MKKYITIALLCVSTYLGAADLRGKIQTIQPVTNDTINFAEVSVAIFYQGDDKKWNNLGNAITNSEGFYFFKNIEPGTYYIQVKKKKNYKVEVKKQAVGVLQDLPVIIFQ